MPINHYAVVVWWSDEDGSWIADAPDLKSCSAFGATREEALAELTQAMDAWLEVARERRLPVPQASFRANRTAA